VLAFLSSYVALEVLIVVVAVGVTLWGRRRRLRRRDQRPLDGFEATDETFIDPTTGIQQRVWFNPRTGERRYRNVERGDGA